MNTEKEIEMEENNDDDLEILKMKEWNRKWSILKFLTQKQEIKKDEFVMF